MGKIVVAATLGPTADFSGTRAKLARAKDLLTDLQREMDEFVASLQALVRRRPEPDLKVHRYVLSRLPPQPGDWPLRVGDIVHNARTALDHAAWQLVLASGNRPDSQTHFPLHHSGGRRRDRLIEGLSEKLARAVEQEQPYVRGGEVNPARLIHELDRIDKHRILLPVVAVPALFSWGGASAWSWVTPEPLRGEAEIARLEFDEEVSDPGASLEFEIRLEPEVDRETALPPTYLRRGDLPRWALGVGLRYISRMVDRLEDAAMPDS